MEIRDKTDFSENNILIYTTDANQVKIDVRLTDETVWLTQPMMANLFQTTQQNISFHLQKIYDEGELDQESTHKKFLSVRTEGKRKVRRNLDFYNLDMILSIGYRIKSSTATRFRIWATNRLKEYLVKGYTINKDRLEQLGNAIQIIRRTEDRLDAKQILDVVESYTFALDMLDDYDHQKITKPSGSKTIYVLTYDECRLFIDKMKFSRAATLFGNEKDDSFKSSIGTIYQTIMGEDVYPSVEEKAANLLYLITKNHSFSDGNKRIAAAFFLYFLDKNNKLYREDGEKTINDHTLVAVTILIAESNSKEKEAMISMIMNFLVK